MTDEPLDLDALERLCEAATPGPWEFDDATVEVAALLGYPTLIAEFRTRTNRERATRDAAFIAAARDALPLLVAEVRRLRKENAQAIKQIREFRRFADPQERFVLVSSLEMRHPADDQREAKS